MSPADRLPGFPADATILHELGHLLIGLEVGIQEQGIEFFQQAGDEIAGARYNSTGLTPSQIMTRGLAGMHFQAELAKDSLDAKFVTELLNGELLDTAPPAALTELMIRQGFRGDWADVLHHSGTLSTDPVQQSQLIRDAYEEVVAITDGKDMKRLAVTLMDDVKGWLTAENEDMRVVWFVIYAMRKPQQMWRDL